jgi:rod shape-determining protein MreD
MSWPAFMVVVVFTFVLQSTVAPRLELFGARPDWMLVVVVFYALHARPPQSIVAGWLTGLLADCATIERAGLVSITFGLTATLVALARDYVFRFGPLSQGLVTATACAFVRMMWLVYRVVVYGSFDSPGYDFGRQILLVSLYTGAWALPVHYGLLRLARVLRIPRPRHVYAGTR